MCRNEGLGVTPWSPLRAGWLSGRFTRGMAAPPAGTRIAGAAERGLVESWDNYATERTWRILDEVEAVAAEAGRTVAQVAMRWLLQAPGVTAPIIGPRTVEHVTDHLGAVGWTLTDDQLARLDKVSAKPMVHPYDILAGFVRRP